MGLKMGLRSPHFVLTEHTLVYIYIFYGTPPPTTDHFTPRCACARGVSMRARGNEHSISIAIVASEPEGGIGTFDGVRLMRRFYTPRFGKHCFLIFNFTNRVHIPIQVFMNDTCRKRRTMVRLLQHLYSLGSYNLTKGSPRFQLFVKWMDGELGHVLWVTK